MRRLLNKVPGVRRLRRALGDALNEAAARDLVQQLRGLKDANDLAIVILMPGALHIGALALDYLEGYGRVLCVANGLGQWEMEALRAKCSVPVVSSRRALPHSDVIDALIEVLNAPFWLVDHDCYLLDVAVLDRERKKLGNQMGLAVYKTTNAKNGIVVPETFLMLVNPAVVRALQEKYGVTTRVYQWEAVPPKAKSRLLEIGISGNRLPEECKSYLDTLRVLALLAEADGSGFLMDHGYSAVCQAYPECIHIGGTSQLHWPPPDRYHALGSYFWRRCLETFGVARAQIEYKKKWPHIPDSQTIRQYVKNSEHSLPGDYPALLDYLDAITARSVQHASFQA
jgi:hypothetical protein